MIEINDTFTRILGFSREESIGRSTLDLGVWITPDDRERFTGAFRKDGYIRDLELVLKTKASNIVTVMISVELIKIDGRACMLSSFFDITARKQAEEALRKSERKLREAQEMAHLGYWDWDVKTGNVQWSEEVYKIFGLDPKTFTPQIDSILALSPWPEDNERDQELINKAIQSHEPGSYEQKFLRPDKSIGHYYSTFQGNYNEQGDLVSIIGSVLDITERKQAEEKVKDSEHHLSEAQRIAKMGSWRWNRETRKFTWSEGLYHLFKLDPSLPPPLLNELSKWYSAEDWKRLDKATTKALENGVPYELELEVKRPDGSRFFSRTTGTPVKDANGSIIAIEGTDQDVTERKQVEDAIRHSEERFRVTFEHATVGMSLTSPEGKLVRINNALAEMLGYSIEELQSMNFVDITYPEDTPASAELIRSLLAGERTVYRLEKRYFHKSGSVIWGDVSSTLVRDTAGAPLHLITSVINITERKWAQEELLKLNRELEDRVLQRTVQLDASNKELEAFAYSVSHDLRAPLRAVDGFSRIILEEYAGKLDVEGNRLLNVVRDNTMKMDQLITDLLELSRTSRADIQISPVDMTKLTQTVFKEIASPEDQKAIKLSVAALPDAMGDFTLLRQVWRNLLGNAIKYSTPKEKRCIEVGGKTVKGENIYYVKDNGVGFNPEYTHKLFGVFQRLHKSSEFEGTGIGLAIVQRIVHRHNGRVWAEGKVGEGATFYFAVPAK
jgi:PAS domain S-box-containing protein